MATKLRPLFTVIYTASGQYGEIGAHADRDVPHRRFMVVVFIITICSQAVFLIISRIPRNPFVGVDLFDMSGGVLVGHGGRYGVAGAVVSGIHGGQRGGHQRWEGQRWMIKTRDDLGRVSWRNYGRKKKSPGGRGRGWVK